MRIILPAHVPQPVPTIVPVPGKRLLKPGGVVRILERMEHPAGLGARVDGVEETLRVSPDPAIGQGRRPRDGDEEDDKGPLVCGQAEGVPALGAGFLCHGHDQRFQQGRGYETRGGGDVGSECFPELKDGEEKGQVVLEGGGVEHVSIPRSVSCDDFEVGWGEQTRPYRAPRALAAPTSRVNSV